MTGYDFETTFENEHLDGRHGIEMTGRTRVRFKTGYVSGVHLPDLMRTIAAHLIEIADDMAFARARAEEREAEIPQFIDEAPNVTGEAFDRIEPRRLTT